MCLECAVHGCGVGITDESGNFGNGKVGSLKQFTSLFYTGLMNILQKSCMIIFFEQASNGGRGHVVMFGNGSGI